MTKRHAPLPTTLLDRDGNIVVVVDVPGMIPPAEGIAWGGRTFFREPSGQYREGLLYNAG